MATEPIFEDRQQADLRPKRFVIAAFVALAGAIGAFPYLLYVGWWPLIGAAALVAALISVVMTAGLETDATDPPSPGEWLLAGYAAVGQVTMSSFGGFMFYGIAYGIAALAVLFGWLDASQRHTWGLWTGLTILVFAIPGFAKMASESLAKWLYERPAGVRTPFSPLLSNPQKVGTVTLAGVGAFILLAVFSDPPSLFFCLGLTLILVYTGLPLIILARRESPDVALEKNLAEFLQSRGYRTLAHPRTRKPDVDPLILGIDLLAWNDDDVFAIDVQRPEPESAPLEGAAAFGIRRASSVIRHELPILDVKESQVTPVLVLVGGSVGDSLAEFSREEDVRVAYFEDPGSLDGTSDNAAMLAEVFNAAGLPIPATTDSTAVGKL